jgi:hypothetical protein
MITWQLMRDWAILRHPLHVALAHGDDQGGVWLVAPHGA